MEHQFVEHKSCDSPYCMVCEGGLAICGVCNLGEGSLTTECPGKSVSAGREQQVYNGHLDFRGGFWVVGVSKYAPMSRLENTDGAGI